MIGQPIDASGAFVTDFNSDNILDIFVDNYSDASLPSYILLGPTWRTPISLLPTQRDAHSRFREIGNTYDRKKCEYYSSSVYDACSLTNWGTIEWQDSVPLGASMTIAIRTGDTPVYDTTWSSWHAMTNGGTIPDYLNARFIQYLAVFQYTDLSYLPSLRDVTLSYTFGLESREESSPSCRFTVSTIPAREQVAIEYEIHTALCRIQFAIYDIAGRCVKHLSQRTLPAGKHAVYWHCDDDNGTKVTSGSYFIVARFDDRISTTKVIVNHP